MSLIECECQVENDVPVDSFGDFVCPKFSVRDMIKMYEEGKKSPASSCEKSTSQSVDELHMEYCEAEQVFRNAGGGGGGGGGVGHEIVADHVEQNRPELINKKIKDSKKYGSKTRIVPTRHGLRIITDVYCKLK